MYISVHISHAFPLKLSTSHANRNIDHLQCFPVPLFGQAPLKGGRSGDCGMIPSQLNNYISVCCVFFFVSVYSSSWICPSSPHLPIVWSSFALSWRACPGELRNFSAYGWVKYTNAPNGFPKHYGAWKTLMIFYSLNLLQWFDLYVSSYSFWRGTTSPYSIYSPHGRLRSVSLSKLLAVWFQPVPIP